MEMTPEEAQDLAKRLGMPARNARKTPKPTNHRPAIRSIGNPDEAECLRQVRKGFISDATFARHERAQDSDAQWQPLRGGPVPNLAARITASPARPRHRSSSSQPAGGQVAGNAAP